jgi:Uma2 family endonuclease
MNDSNKKDPQDPQLKESPVTYEIYAKMPDDGNRYEIADGHLELMSPGPNPFHQILLFELQRKIADDCGHDYIIFFAPLDVILSDIEVRQPDLIMVHRSRLHIISNRGIEGAPDLVVEISSEHSLRRDKFQKTKTYAKYGIPEYWIIDMTNYTLEQYILHDRSYELVELYSGDERISSEKLQCVSFTINDLMKDLSKLSN